MRKTLKEIALEIGGEVIGRDELVITGVSGIKEASSGDITFLSNPKYAPLLETTCASAVITSKDITVAPSGKSIIRTENPSLAFSKVISFIFPETIKHPKGIHPSAIVAKNVKLGVDVALGAYVVVEEGVKIGQGSIIYPGCYIGQNVEIGLNTLVYPNVSIRERTIIGSRVIIHSGAVLGSDGFGFVTLEGKHRKIPQVGIVEVSDDVEIGDRKSVV